MSDTYNRFIEKVREIGQLEAIEQLLEWDQETNMPERGLAARAEHMALAARMKHERRTSPELGELLSALDGSADDPVVATNVRETRRVYERAVKVPGDLVAKIASVSSMARAEWVGARKASDFKRFAPYLKELLDLKRQLADAVGFAGERYDALLDEYEPGARTSDLAQVFAELREPLAAFIREISSAAHHPDEAIVHRSFPRAAQEAFARKLAAAIGFDFQAGRLDVSAHPFCTGIAPGDVRMTTRYHETHFNSAIFGVLHETGHGLYEQGLDEGQRYTPMGQAVSLGIHESQSLMWENIVGRSRAFWEYFYPECRATFSKALKGVSLDAWVGAINVVKPSMIRVEADEATYNLHIILRFELERALLDGNLAVNDVPEAWNAKMEELLGIRPAGDAEGCLQDIHWSLGIFGYFPTYALGKLYGAQFWEAARRDIPDVEDRFRCGDFRVLLDWLRGNIHRRGKRYRPDELVRAVTGEPLSIRPFMNYLHEKFAPIYGVAG